MAGFFNSYFASVVTKRVVKETKVETIDSKGSARAK